MKQIFHEIIIKTKGQNLYDFTEKTKDWVSTKKFCNGILSINVLHTSASLIIQENADPDVLYDLKFFFNKLVPMDNNLYKHTTEGIDDMPAHIKSALTQTSLSIPIENFEITLGSWQGIYLFEHRIEKHTRILSNHLIGD